MAGRLTRAFLSREQINQIAETVLGKKLAGRPEQPILEQSIAQNFELGARFEYGPSVYRYGLAGAVGLDIGVLCQAPVPPADHIDLVPSASYAIGTKVITATLGATGVAANEFADGWLYVNDGTGQGQRLRVLSHPAALATATCRFTCIDALTIALNVADSLISLVANPYSAIIVHPSPPTAQLVGVPNRAITAAFYGWFQTRGPCVILTQGVLYIGQQVRPSGAVDGAVEHANIAVTTGSTAAGVSGNGALAEDSAAAETVVRLANSAVDTTYDLGSLHTILGKVMRVNVSTDYSLVWLTME